MTHGALLQDAAPPRIARLLSLLLPVALALYANFQGVQQILVPVQVEAIDPLRKVADLAMLTMMCSLTGVFGLTMGGAVSDGTRGRWGRRAPWLAGMAAVSALLSMLLGAQRSLATIALFYSALWFTLNFFQGALLAVTPDRVPASRRSFASSIFGFAAPLGAFVGVNVAALAPGQWGYLALAAMLAITTAAFVIVAREAAAIAPAAHIETAVDGGRARSALRLLEGFASRDFSLAYAFRILMFAAQFSINNYLLYILQDHIGVQNLPGGDPQIAAGALNSVRTLSTIVAILIGVWFAHRTERRKVFAEIYAVSMAAAMIVPVVSPTWPGMLAFGAFGGLAMGVYSTVDLDLMSRVLPSGKSAGRDLALLAMAGAAAQFVAPLIGGTLIEFFGYNALFVTAAVTTLAAGGVARFLRGVR